MEVIRQTAAFLLALTLSAGSVFTPVGMPVIAEEGKTAASGQDAEQTEEEKDSLMLSAFQADVSDVLIETYTPVTFTVRVDSEVPPEEYTLAVYDQAKNNIGYLHDDGENGDAVADDDCGVG